jgi:NADH dehydrogenase
VNVVTGAFGYIGKYISRALLERGRTVCTVTTHPNKPSPFGPAVKAFSYSFDDGLGQETFVTHSAEFGFLRNWTR